MSLFRRGVGAFLVPLFTCLAVACDCGDERVGLATTGITLVTPPGLPEEFERTLDLGTQRVAKLATSKLLFRNDGIRPASVTLAKLETTSPDFYLAGAAPLPTLDPGATWEIELRYLPSDIGEDTAEIVVETDAADTPRYLVRVKARGASSQIDVCSTDATGAEHCFSKAQADGVPFVVEVGEAAPGVAIRKPLVVKNLGDASMIVSKVAPSELTSSEYTTEAKAGVTARADGSFDVGSSQTAVFDIVYAPVDGGDDEGFVEVLSDDPNSPRILVALKATGLAPRLCVEPLAVDFGDSAVAATAHKALKLTSCGREKVTVNVLQVVNPATGDVFAIANAPALPLELPAGDAVELDLTYTPRSSQEDLGQINIRSTGGNGRVPLRGRGVGCTLSVVPSRLDFGQVSSGGRTSKTFQIRNTDTGECSVASMTGPSAPFAVDSAPAFPVTLPPGQVVAVVVSFAPTSVGTYADRVAFAASVAGGQLNVPLSGQGITAPPCDLQAQPTNVVFTNVSTGQTATQSVLLKNYGTDDCYITKGEIARGSSPAFTATAGGFPPPTVPSGGQITVPVKFTPTTPGTHNGTLHIEFNDNGQPCFPPLPCGAQQKLDVSLEGGTLAPAICLDPTEIDFGAVAAGGTASQSFVIRSCGAGALGLRGVTVAPGSSLEFALGTQVRVPQFLAPGQSITVNVSYAPRTNGADFGRISVLNNDPANPNAVVKLRANATTVCDKQLACGVDKLSFPTMEIGRSSSMTVVCQNVGSQALTVSSTGFSRTTSAEFKASAGRLPRTVAPGASVRFEVTYTPQDAGTDLGELQISSDACQPSTVALEASGKQPSYPRCVPPQSFQPVEKWAWSGGSTNTSSRNVAMSPLVLSLNDDDGDGRINESDVPDVIFTSCKSGECCINCLNVQDMKMMDVSGKGALRAVHGRDGREMWSSDASLPLTAVTQLAAGDLDGDNVPELVAVKYHFQPGSGSTGMEGKYKSGALLVFDNAGRLKFETEQWVGDEKAAEQAGAPTIGDLDGDGAVEIIFERTVFKNDGSRLFDLPGSGNFGHGAFTSIVDLDADGVPEIIQGKTVYTNTGTQKWTTRENNGSFAILDIDNDGRAEVVLRTDSFSFVVLNAADGSRKAGPFTWNGPLDSNGQAAAVCPSAFAAADVDGDRKPEIIIPSGDYLRVVKPDTGALVWQMPIDDYSRSCGASGAAAFDFEGDGRYEVVYHDSDHMYVFRGQDGTKIYDAPRNSSTIWETPVIADVDNDGHADLVMTNENGILGIGGGAGVKVLSNVGNNWPATRRIWNEHAYHQTSVNENGSVPRVESPHWKGAETNNWRANPPLCR